MTRAKSTLILLALAAVAALAVAAPSAFAHGGPGKGGRGASAGISNALLKDAATRLGVTTARLKEAITAAAVTRIDEAADDGDLDADDAADLKETAEDNLRVAYGLSTARGVAAKLGTTAAKLNTAFREARKAQVLARIAAALEDEDITSEEAAELREEVDDATFPGYKPSPFSRGGRGFGRGFGFGFGR
jgi:hypothetical protein